jgi:phosphoribosylformimino-5-aminoimidazole carboxamide ribotide isomerase
MKFRPCIDLHGGQVKQIVGSTLRDDQNTSSSTSATTTALRTNFTAKQPAEWFANLYRQDQLIGGHVIMLGPGNADAARAALAAYPNQLQVGGGITLETAQEWINAGASHVIITSYVFANGKIHKERLQSLVNVIGKERLVLDLSCRRRPRQSQEDTTSSSTTTTTTAAAAAEDDGEYYVVTDKWQKFTTTAVNAETLQDLAQYCDEFLIHGVDVEGLQCGILPDLVTLLGQVCPIPVTYAGGVRSIEDLELVKTLGNNKVDCTVGSALDIFGGSLSYENVVTWHKEQQNKEETSV